MNSCRTGYDQSRKVQFHYKKHANPQITVYVPSNEILIRLYTSKSIYNFQWFIKSA